MVLGLVLLLVFGLGIPLLFGFSIWYWAGRSEIALSTFLLFFVHQLLTAGTIEEIVFRGHVFKKLQDNYKNWVAVIVSAVIFGAIHIPSFVVVGNDMLPANGWIYVLMATLMGLLYGVFRAKGATMVTLILSHALYNAVFAAVLVHLFY